MRDDDPRPSTSAVRLPKDVAQAVRAWAAASPGRRVQGMVRWALEELAADADRALARAQRGMPSAPVGETVVRWVPARDRVLWLAADDAVRGAAARAGRTGRSVTTGALVRGLVRERMGREGWLSKV